MRIALRQSYANWLLLVIVSLPPLCTAYLVSYICAESNGSVGLCKLYFRAPLLCVNLLWFLHVDLTFYVISLIQDSTWLIDPYWALAPLMLAAFWATHPLALLWTPRQTVSLLLLLAWAARLTHSYFRRERWIAGAREDWRYTEMKERFGKWWTVVQVFAVYAVQHCMLVGLTLPWMPIFFSTSGWNRFDACGTFVCVLGLAIAAHADNTLHDFVTTRKVEDSRVLRKGLWAISRHPNHLGEQMWWWGVALFGIAAGSPWTVVGTVFNTLCMWQIMAMVEVRMRNTESRAQEYKRYQREVAFCIPWFAL